MGDKDGGKINVNYFTFLLALLLIFIVRSINRLLFQRMLLVL